MSQKEIRRKKAMQKAARKKTVAIIVCSLALVAVAVFAISAALQEPDERVFVSGASSVTLNRDGTFAALLPYNVRHFGTFTETRADGVTTVAFSYDGRTDNGVLRGDVLSLPSVWQPNCFHRHSLNFSLR